MPPESPTPCHIHNRDLLIVSYSIQSGDHCYSSLPKGDFPDNFGFSSLWISLTPVADSKDLKGVGATIEIHLLADLILEPFQRYMGKLYNPAAPFTDEMVVVLMAQYVFVMVRVSPEVHHLQEPAVHEKLQGPINGRPRGSLSLFSDREKEVLSLEVVVASKCLLEDDMPLAGEP